MARSSHSKQREPGLQCPLRPAIALLSNGAKTLAQDAFPADWTAAGTLLEMSLVSGYPLMDDRSRISISSGDLVLQQGIWEIDFYLAFVSTTAGHVSFAVTNAAGDTVHAQSRPIDMEATDGNQGYIKAIVVVTDPAGETVAFRAAGEQADAAVSASITSACVKRIGNHDEQ